MRCSTRANHAGSMFGTAALDLCSRCMKITIQCFAYLSPFVRLGFAGSWRSMRSSAVGHNDERGERHREAHKNEACAVNNVCHDLGPPWVCDAVFQASHARHPAPLYERLVRLRLCWDDVGGGMKAAIRTFRRHETLPHACSAAACRISVASGDLAIACSEIKNALSGTGRTVSLPAFIRQSSIDPVGSGAPPNGADDDATARAPITRTLVVTVPVLRPVLVARTRRVVVLVLVPIVLLVLLVVRQDDRVRGLASRSALKEAWPMPMSQRRPLQAPPSARLL